MSLTIRLAILGTALALSFGHAALMADAMRVHVIDVGQGAATLVECPCGAVLIDTGGERTPDQEWLPAIYDSTPALVGYLREFFKGRPDLNNQLALLYLTHPHPDHTRGVAAVIKEFRPRSVVTNGQSTGVGADWQTLARDYAKSAGVPSWFVLARTSNHTTGLTNAAIDPLSCSPTDPKLRALWGQVENSTGWDIGDFGDANNHSAVLRIDYGQASILFTGDLEEATHPGNLAGIERLVAAYKSSGLLDADVYHVGHHGSHNGTTPGLVSAISPEIAVISAGPACQRDGFTAWTHGHPRTVTIHDLEQGVSGTRVPKNVKAFDHFGAQPTTLNVQKAIYSTGWDGTIVLQGESSGAWSVASTTGPHSCLQ